MKRFKTLFLLLTALCSFFPALLYSWVDTAWVRRYNGPGNSSDDARALAIDNTGNVYVTGYSTGSGTGQDCTTIKYNFSGDTVWVRRYNGPGNGGDRANAIAVDNSGNVYVAGYSVVSGPGSDYLTIKYNSNGDTVWARTYNGPGNSSDAVNAMAVDGSGNVYVTGESYGSGTVQDWATIKYNSIGDTLWVRRYNGPGNNQDRPKAIAVDNLGNVYVTGYTTGSSTLYDYTTIKYNSNGDTLWLRSYNGPGNSFDGANAIAVDNSGNVYVTGQSTGSGTAYDYLTIKYNSSGDTLWLRRYNGPLNSVDGANAIAIDNSGNVYVTGGSGISSLAYDWATIKYNSSGDTLWLRTYNGPGNGEDVGQKIAFDTLGNVYVGGYSGGSGTGADFTTIKYNSSGDALWLTRYNGPGNGSDYANAIAIDNSGNVYITGSSNGSGTSNDFATIKYIQWQYTKDVGCAKIVAPSGVIDSGVVVTPACSVFNYGTVAQSYSVRMKIGSLYNNTASVTNHLPGTYQYLTFPNWTANNTGTIAVSCSTELALDSFPGNDKRTITVLVRVLDVGVTQIIAPSGTIDSTGPIIPQGRVKNYGTNTETFTVTFKIGTSYIQTLSKTLDAGIEDTVNFPAWSPARGTYTTRCSTYLAGDVNHNNDTLAGSVTVQVQDVGVTQINTPSGTIEPNNPVIPQALVKNYGTTTRSFFVTFKIGSVYTQTRARTLDAGIEDTVNFLVWNPVQGTYTTSCSTYMVGDANHNNDILFGSVTVQAANVQWSKMADVPTAPSGKNPKGGSSMAGLNGKIYFLKASNTKDFSIFTPNTGIGSWTSDTMPLGSKEAGDGKNPKKGASITGLGNSLYALRGNNTPGFWAYQTSPAESIGWHKLANITTGAKNPKDASGLVGVNISGTDYIFVMKGSKTDEFYLYNILTNTWTPTPTKPTAGTSGKVGYKKGSCLAWDGDSLVYVLKGNYGDLFKYNLYTNLWTELRCYDARVFVNFEGKKKKFKDGAGMAYYNGALYLLKGGNTYDFWEYDIVQDSYIQMGPGANWDIPTGSGKRVKGGGCITILDNYFYVAKGSNTPEFYRHGLPVLDFLTLPKSTFEGAIGKTITANLSTLTIVPNPAKSYLAIYLLPTPECQEIKIFDMSGTLVKTEKVTSPQSHKQELRISLKGINPGIYFLRVGKETKKFLVVK